jgi:hypothetical protein
MWTGCGAHALHEYILSEQAHLPLKPAQLLCLRVKDLRLVQQLSTEVAPARPSHGGGPSLRGG